MHVYTSPDQRMTDNLLNSFSIGISHDELSPPDVTVSLQMPVSATEGNVVTISVDLSNVPGDGLEVELVVTLSATSGTASKCVNTYVLIGSICPVFSSDLIFHSHGKIIPARV